MRPPRSYREISQRVRLDPEISLTRFARSAWDNCASVRRRARSRAIGSRVCSFMQLLSSAAVGLSTAHSYGSSHHALTGVKWDAQLPTRHAYKGDHGWEKRPPPGRPGAIRRKLI